MRILSLAACVCGGIKILYSLQMSSVHGEHTKKSFKKKQKKLLLADGSILVFFFFYQPFGYEKKSFTFNISLVGFKFISTLWLYEERGVNLGEISIEMS